MPKSLVKEMHLNSVAGIDHKPCLRDYKFFCLLPSLEPLSIVRDSQGLPLCLLSRDTRRGGVLDELHRISLHGSSLLFWQPRPLHNLSVPTLKVNDSGEAGHQVPVEQNGES